MRLLYDENLSPALVRRLSDIFPNSVHVRDAGLKSASDEAIVAHALERALTIVTKDGDFAILCANLPRPPRVVWLRIGNCPARDVANMIRRRAPEILKWASSSAVLLPLRR